MLAMLVTALVTVHPECCSVCWVSLVCALEALNSVCTSSGLSTNVRLTQGPCYLGLVTEVDICALGFRLGLLPSEPGPGFLSSLLFAPDIALHSLHMCEWIGTDLGLLFLSLSPPGAGLYL